MAAVISAMSATATRSIAGMRRAQAAWRRPSATIAPSETERDGISGALSGLSKRSDG